MADPSMLDVFRIPAPILIALDSRAYHFALQPYHHLVRLAHILAMAGFFGAIALLDLRLIGLGRKGEALRGFAEFVLPWLTGLFGVTAVSGLALFLYDPVHVGSHAYFAPKLILLVLGLANAALFHRLGYVEALAAERTMPATARLAGALSLLTWTGVMVCACLNGEAAPKLLLR